MIASQECRCSTSSSVLCSHCCRPCLPGTQYYCSASPKSALQLLSCRSPTPCEVICSGVDAMQGLMASTFFLGFKVDEIIARQQRRQLGLCPDCGGLYTPNDCQPADCPCKQQQKAG